MALGWLEVLESESSLDSGLACELAAGLPPSFECGEAATERSEALCAGKAECQGRAASRSEAGAQQVAT